MDRMKKLEDSIREHWAERTEIKKKFIEQHYEEMVPGFYEKLKYLMDEQKRRRKDDTQRKIQSFYLCRLMTSIYTESYEAVLGIANSELYLDEKKSETYWLADLVYKNIDKDMMVVDSLLRKKFVHLEMYELFQLKKILLNEEWKLLQEIFLRLMKNSLSLIIGSSLELESEVQILSGNYMDKPEILWCTSTCDRVKE